jgi:hypothetical protein
MWLVRTRFWASLWACTTDSGFHDSRSPNPPRTRRAPRRRHGRGGRGAWDPWAFAYALVACCRRQFDPEWSLKARDFLDAVPVPLSHNETDDRRPRGRGIDVDAHQSFLASSSATK